MLQDLTLDSFAPHRGSRFLLHLDPADPASVVELELVDITGRRPGALAPPPGSREPFSVVFRGPLATFLPQRIYRLENEAMGTLDIFIVPIARDAAGFRYEAVFT